MQEKLNVLFMPKWDGANPYQRLLLEQLDKLDVDTNIVDYRKGIFRIYAAARPYLNKNKKNILHLHWLSPIFMEIAWSKNPLIFSIKYILLFCDLTLCKLRGFKIVWTIHNKFAHEGNDKSNEIRLRRLIFRFASDVIVHSEEAIVALSHLYKVPIEDKATVIKHGNYIGVYPSPSEDRLLLRERFNYKENQKVFLLFGALKRYKGVETFIELANLFSQNDNYLFIIAGEPQTAEYAQELSNTLFSNNVEFIQKYLDDQTLVDTISAADAIILPFVDTLASGSMLLSMSLGKPVFLSHKGVVFGCVKREYELFFDSIEELVSKVESINIESLQRIGVQNYRIAEKNNWGDVASKTKFVYEGKRAVENL